MQRYDKINAIAGCLLLGVFCGIGVFAEDNPLFPALRSGPTARSGAYPKSKFLAAPAWIFQTGSKGNVIECVLLMHLN